MTDDNKVELYKTILEQEISNHTIFITVLLGIVILVIGSTWWWNKNGAIKEIESEVEKKFEKEKQKIIKQFKKKIKKNISRKISKYEGQVLFIEADVARSMAISARKDKFYSHSIYWWSKYLENSIKLDLQTNVRKGVEWILLDLELLEVQDDKENRKNIHACDDIVEIIKQVPDILEKERKKILKMCIGRNNEDEFDDDYEEDEIIDSDEIEVEEAEEIKESKQKKEKK